jgi:hypothetical protein
MKRCLSILSGLFLLFGLSACGGGNSSGGVADSGTITGVAATGAPIAYKKIYLRDSSSVFKNMSSVTSSTGEYLFPLAGLSQPFFLKISDSSGNYLYSVGTGAGTGKVNPLTSIAVANAAGTGDPRKVFLNISSLGTPQRITPSTIKNATDNVQNLIKPLSEGYNLTTFNPISGSFSANAMDPFDRMLDNINVKIDPVTGQVAIDMKNSSGVWTQNAVPPVMIAAPSITVSAGDNIPVRVDYIQSFPHPMMPMVVSSGGTFQFIALVTKLGESISWSVKEANGGTVAKTNNGFGDYTALYTAPAVTVSSQFTIVAQHVNGSHAEAIITVTPATPVTGGGTSGSGAGAFIGTWKPSGGMDPASYQFTATEVQAILPVGTATPLPVNYSGNVATAVFTPPAPPQGIMAPQIAGATWVFTIATNGTMSISVGGMSKPGIYVKQP